MNVKPGQIARITQRGPNWDRRVHVDALHSERGKWLVTSLQPMWCFTRQREVRPGIQGNCLDEHLQPVGDLWQDDQSFAWAGKPNEVQRIRAWRQ